MKKSGLADSPLFATPLLSDTMEIKKKKHTKIRHLKDSGNNTGPQDNEITKPLDHDTTVEVIRKAVKKIGKEAATYRFSQDEKKAISIIIYNYKNRNIRTSENEIVRIAINFIINDYKNNGDNSNNISYDHNILCVTACISNKNNG